MVDVIDDEIEVISSQAKDIRFASSVYFRASELDFLHERYSPETMTQETPKNRKSPGKEPTKRAAIKERILIALRNGRDIGDRDHEAIVTEFGEGATRGTCVAALREALSEFQCQKADTVTDAN